MSSKSLKFRQYQFQIIRKKNDRKIFHSSAKLIASDSDIDEAFKSMHQSIMTKLKTYACKDRIVLDVIISTSYRTVQSTIWTIISEFKDFLRTYFPAFRQGK